MAPSYRLANVANQTIAKTPWRLASLRASCRRGKPPFGLAAEDTAQTSTYVPAQ
jgi:hypothetical protein